MVFITPFTLDRHDVQTVAGLIIESAPELFSAMFGRRAGVILQELIRRSHNRFSHRYIWVAEQAQQIVGIVVAIPAENLHNTADYAGVLNPLQQVWLGVLNRLILSRVLRHNYPSDALYIANLAVDAPYRSQGIGTQMLHHCIEQGRALNAIALFISVDIDNPQAQRLYERMGFEVIEQHILSLLGFTIGARLLTLPLR